MGVFELDRVLSSGRQDHRHFDGGCEGRHDEVVGASQAIGSVTTRAMEGFGGLARNVAFHICQIFSAEDEYLHLHWKYHSRYYQTGSRCGNACFRLGDGRIECGCPVVQVDISLDSRTMRKWKRGQHGDRLTYHTRTRVLLVKPESDPERQRRFVDRMTRNHALMNCCLST